MTGGCGAYIYRGQSTYGSVSHPQQDNLSGAAFDQSQSNTVWVVVNSPTRLLHFDLKGQLLHKVKLQGFADPEGNWLQMCLLHKTGHHCKYEC
jgi:uncharacterized protein YjiK